MERDQVLKVMVPVGAFAVLLLVVGVVIALNNGGGTPTSGTGSSPPTGPEQPPPPGDRVKPFDFPLDGPEWKDLGDGLKIWDVKEGSGVECPTLEAKPGVIPIMNYTGWLTNGTPFDSSVGKKPLDLPLSRLVSGWKQGVPGMKVGGVRRLIVPSRLGYGSQPQPGIPANSTLVFEMELLGVQ